MHCNKTSFLDLAPQGFEVQMGLTGPLERSLALSIAGINALDDQVSVASLIEGSERLKAGFFAPVQRLAPHTGSQMPGLPGTPENLGVLKEVVQEAQAIPLLQRTPRAGLARQGRFDERIGPWCQGSQRTTNPVFVAFEHRHLEQAQEILSRPHGTSQTLTGQPRVDQTELVTLLLHAPYLPHPIAHVVGHQSESIGDWEHPHIGADPGTKGDRWQGMGSEDRKATHKERERIHGHGTGQQGLEPKPTPIPAALPDHPLLIHANPRPSPLRKLRPEDLGGEEFGERVHAT